MASTPDSSSTWTPRGATPLALAVLVVWVLVLCLPMFTGKFLGVYPNDQVWGGIPFRQFWADEFRRTGDIPLWNPFLFGGMPFVGSMHGDMFYPTSFLRALLRADTVLNLTFAIHLVLAGWLGYAFLRVLGVSWSGAVTGGLAYQLSGIIASQVSPGHDGKLIVSALFPLLLTGLVLAIRRRRVEGYGLAALVVGLDILSPQVQMAQYSLIAAGLFTLWLCFLDPERPETQRARWSGLAVAAVAVALGLGLTMVQTLPFLANSPYAARVAGNQGWQYAISWSMPPENILDWLVADFTGVLDNYWGRNGVKLHSEYLGAATIVLATIGAADRGRRRLVWFLGGIALLFVLVALAGATPFYRLWYTVVPFVKVTRAAGMAFFIPAFVVCSLAAFGVERLERGQGGRGASLAWLVGAGLLLLLGISGALTGLAESLALPSGRDPQAAANSTALALSALRSALAAAAAAGIGLALLKGRLRIHVAAGLLMAVIGTDQFLNARRFFHWSPPGPVLYRPDTLVSHLKQVPGPWRVADLAAGNREVYPGNYLMYSRIPSVLGHHGNELHAYDQLLGGKNVWNRVMSPRIWDLLAVRFLVIPVNVRVPGYHVVLRAEATSPTGQEAFLYEADSAPAWARIVPGAVKVAEAQIPPTVLDPRLDIDRLVLLPETASVAVPRLDSMPAPMAARAQVTSWEPGEMIVRLDPAPEHDAWLVVAENWYPDWQVTVDGRPATAWRGQGTLLAVPVPRGAREARFHFASPSSRRGGAISLASLAAILLWVVVPPLRRRRRG